MSVTSNGGSSSSSSSQPFHTSLTPKFVLALLNGLVKMSFYADATITVPYLQEQLFANQTGDADKQIQTIHSFRDALLQAASENWTVEQITQHFSQGGLTAEQTEAVSAVWKRESKKIHDQLVLASGFSTPHYTSLNWRLDVQTHSRYVNEMNQPTAIVQINTKSTIAAAPTISTVRDEQLQFEMDRSSVANVLLELEKIEAIMSGAQ